jgi:hypothetical protein
MRRKSHGAVSLEFAEKNIPCPTGYFLNPIERLDSLQRPCRGYSAIGAALSSRSAAAGALPSAVGDKVEASLHWPAPLQVILSVQDDRSASTYPASGPSPGQDEDTRVPVLIKPAAVRGTDRLNTNGNGQGPTAYEVRYVGSILDAALHYALVLRIPVFPCNPDDKRPLTVHGFKDANAGAGLADALPRRHDRHSDRRNFRCVGARHRC